MTTLQWQLPAWALAYYLSHYKEQYDQEKKEQVQQDFNELYEVYQRGLRHFLSQFDEFIVQNDGIIALRGLGDELKKDCNGLVDLYTQIINHPEQKKRILMTPAQELYARYIAYRVAKKYKLPIGADQHGLYKAIINNAEDINAIDYLNELGLAIGDPYNFLNKFKDLLNDNDTFNKISDAVKFFKGRIDQREKDRQSFL